MIKRLFLFTIVLFAVHMQSYAQYCTNNQRFTELQYFDSTEITIGNNIQYGAAQNFQGNSVALLMDLYYPKLLVDTSSKRPFVMLFHGGGFTSGDKQSGDIKDLCIRLALRGFVCASVNYRLGDTFTEYGQYKARYRAIQDGHAALRYIVNNANSIRVDTNWIFVAGQSAGSLLALGMVYADQDELDSVSLLYNNVACSIELGGLYNSGNNLNNTYSIKGVFNNWGAVNKNEMDVNEMIPSIAFHGEQDTTVLIDEDHSFSHYSLMGSRAIHYELVTNNICSEITIDTMAEHGVFRNASAEFRAQRASCFFRSIFCDNCSNFYTTDSIPSNCSSILTINNNLNEASIKVYPNPVNHSFNIDGLVGTLKISISDVMGNLLYTNETTDSRVHIELMPGLYLLEILHRETNRSYKAKIVKAN